MIAWKRCSNIEDRDLAIGKPVQLVVKNIGVVTAYSRESVWRDVEENAKAAQRLEDEKDVLQFLRHSSIATFIHHSALLITIMMVGNFFPTAMENWSSEWHFPIRPGMQIFLWIFGTVLIMGFCSVTLILCQAQSMLQIKTNELKSQDQEEVIELP